MTDRQTDRQTGYPSIDKPWLKFYSDRAINSSVPTITIWEYMYESNKNYPNDIAIRYFSREIRFKEFFNHIDECAKSLNTLGVKPGEIVTVALPSIPEALYIVYALNKIGAVANMIHPLAGENEIVNYINEVESKVVIIFDKTLDIIKNSIGKTGIKQAVVVTAGESLSIGMKQLFSIKNGKIDTNNLPCITWKKFISIGRNNSIPEVKKDINSIAIISHTGGTTGEPKGVMCSDRNANALMHQIVCNFEYDRQGTSLAVLPPFINYSLIEAMMAMLVIGYKVVLIPDYKPLEFDKYIKKYRPNVVLSIPAYWEAMLKIDGIEKVDMSCFEQIYAGGEAINEEIEKVVNEMLLSCGSKTTLLKGLGATEMTGGATQTYTHCNVPGSVGLPLVRINCKVVSQDSCDELGYNKEGEICYSGDTVMMGYYNNQAATDKIIKIHEDGVRWLHTGDLGYIDEDGIIYVTGRIKRILMTKGDDNIATKLFPDRVEKVIYSHDSVELCCVVGKPDAERINIPVAFITLKNGIDPNDELINEIKALCHELLPTYMIPDKFIIKSEFPRTDRGKVDYKMLERMVTNEKMD